MLRQTLNWSGYYFRVKTFADQYHKRNKSVEKALLNFQQGFLNQKQRNNYLMYGTFKVSTLVPLLTLIRYN